MALLKKLKSILGLGGSDRDPNQRRDVGVTVEREAGEPNRGDASAGAGSGTETGTGTGAEGTGAATAETSAPATGTDDGAPEHEAPTGDGDEADADAGATAAPETSESATAAASDASDATPAADEATSDGDDLEEIKGVGPAYAQRLRDAGVGSVADLADADAETLAEETDLSPNRIGNWIEQAAQR